MRIYLYICCLQRPLDDQTQPRIRVETEAVLAILAAGILALSEERIEITDAAERLAESLESRGVGPMDAVHLALASVARVDFFATCDDRLLRKAKGESGLDCKVVSALALVSEAMR
jgi:predicted nucleic acid-binding protein